nr:hypothetical protein CFP56_20288 [Quercus suber]
MLELVNIARTGHARLDQGRAADASENGRTLDEVPGALVTRDDNSLVTYRVGDQACDSVCLSVVAYAANPSPTTPPLPAYFASHPARSGRSPLP